MWQSVPPFWWNEIAWRYKRHGLRADLLERTKDKYMSFMIYLRIDRSPLMRDRLKKVWHYLAAFAIIFEGIDGLDQAGRNWPFILLCWVAAVIIIAVTIIHSRVKIYATFLETLIYLLEGVVCGSIGFLTLEEGKAGLSYVWFIAGILCLVATGIQWFQWRSQHRESRSVGAS